MKPKPIAPAPEKDFDRDIKAYERQPARTKEISQLKDQAEKTAGPERVRLDKKIRTNA